MLISRGAVENSNPNAVDVLEGQKKLCMLIDKVKRNESLLYLTQRRKEHINARLKEIDKKMANLSSTTSGPSLLPSLPSLVANAALASFLLDNAKPLMAGNLYTNEEVGILFRLWMHLADFHDVYNLTISDVSSIFSFYEQLKALSKEGASCENITKLSSSSYATYDLYCSLCILALDTILRDFKEPDHETPEEEQEEKASLKEGASISAMYAFLFQNLDIDKNCVSITDWFVVCAMLFWSYVEDPGLPCSTPLAEKMKSCFEKVREVPVWRWESEWMVMVLLALCEMASDSSKMMDEMEDNIERRKQRLKERMEWKKNSLEAKDVPALSAEKAKIEPEAEALVPDPSFSEEQKKYVEELMRLVEAKKVEEVKVRPKECFKCRRRCTGRRTLASSPTSEPKPTPSRSGRSRGAPTRCWTRRDAKRGGRRSSASGGRATRRS